MTNFGRGFLILDALGNIKFDTDGYAICMLKDGRQFKIPKNDIDFCSGTLNLIVDDETQVCINLPQSRMREIFESRPQNDQNNQNNQNNENDQNDQNDENGTVLQTSSQFLWKDTSTKLLLDIYKSKKDLVSTRKIKTTV